MFIESGVGILVAAWECDINGQIMYASMYFL